VKGTGTFSVRFGVVGDYSFPGGMCEDVFVYRTQNDRVYVELKTQRIILFERHITADQKSLGFCLPLCVQL